MRLGWVLTPYAVRNAEDESIGWGFEYLSGREAVMVP